MTPAERAAARERCAKATPEPWRRYGLSGITSKEYDIANEYRYVCDECGAEASVLPFTHADDALFTAHARTDLPAALDEIERLARENGQLRRDWLLQLSMVLRECGGTLAVHEVHQVAASAADMVHQYEDVARAATVMTLITGPGEPEYVAVPIQGEVARLRAENETMRGMLREYVTIPLHGGKPDLWARTLRLLGLEEHPSQLEGRG